MDPISLIGAFSVLAAGLCISIGGISAGFGEGNAACGGGESVRLQKFAAFGGRYAPVQSFVDLCDGFFPVEIFFIAFGRFTQPVSLKVFRENLANDVISLVRVHVSKKYLIRQS